MKLRLVHNSNNKRDSQQLLVKHNSNSNKDLVKQPKLSKSSNKLWQLLNNLQCKIIIRLFNERSSIINNWQMQSSNKSLYKVLLMPRLKYSSHLVEYKQVFLYLT